MPAWQPILDGEKGRRARNAVVEIAAALRAAPPTAATFERDPHFRGEFAEAEVALFLAYATRAGLVDAADAVDKNLSEAIDAVGRYPLSEALHGGFVGTAWILDHLARLDESETDVTASADADVDAEVDAVLLDHLGSQAWDGSYDLISGLVGFGVYALERLPRPAARSCAERVIRHLAALSSREEVGVSWFSAPHELAEHLRERYPHGYYDCGMAHGVAGVTAFLASAVEQDVAVKVARPLLAGAADWLLSIRQPPSAGASFPSGYVPNRPPRDCRSAWCYGDPGVAIALDRAADALGSSRIRQAAVDVGLRSAQRPPEEAGVVDVGLCHGAAGLAHLWNRFYQATGDERLLRSSRTWFEVTLSMRRDGRGIAGFAERRRTRAGESFWYAERGLLSGAAGVGLALLAAITDQAPAWDRLLALSARPPLLQDEQRPHPRSEAPTETSPS